MAAITPTNLYTLSMGSAKLNIAEFDGASDGDIWESGIENVISVIGGIADSVGDTSSSGAQYTFTASNGTIYMQGESSSKFVAWIASGFGNRDV